MDVNQRQAEWIEAQGWLDRHTLYEQMRRLQTTPGLDLAGLLLKAGFLDVVQVGQLRQAFRATEASPANGSRWRKRDTNSFSFPPPSAPNPLSQSSRYAPAVGYHKSPVPIEPLSPTTAQGGYQSVDSRENWPRPNFGGRATQADPGAPNNPGFSGSDEDTPTLTVPVHQLPPTNDPAGPYGQPNPDDADTDVVVPVVHSIPAAALRQSSFQGRVPNQSESWNDSAEAMRRKLMEASDERSPTRSSSGHHQRLTQSSSVNNFNANQSGDDEPDRFYKWIEERQLEALAKQGTEEETVRSSQPQNDVVIDFTRSLGFEYVRMIKGGTSGLVLKIRKPSTGEYYALKILFDAEESSDDRARFERESRILKNLNHPNIVRVREAGTHKKRCFQVMELVEGEDLKSIVESRFSNSSQLLPIEEIIAVFTDVAAGLAYCHRRGVVHRDIKPSNIVVEKNRNHAILVDFGLVKKLKGGDKLTSTSSSTASGGSITKSGVVVGTPAFMSPEHLSVESDDIAVGPYSDVWSFGATLYFALTFRSPTEGASLVEILTRLKACEIEKPTSFNPEVPLWLEDLCMRCLHKDFTRRPDMGEVVQQFHNQASKSAWRRRMIFATPLIPVLLCLAWIFLQGPKPEIEYLAPMKSRTRDRTFLLSGRVNRTGFKLCCNGRVIPVDRRGNFQEYVEVEEGKNQFELKIAESDKVYDVRQFEVERDTLAPIIQIFNSREFNKVRVGFDGLVKGSVSDQNFESLNLVRENNVMPESLTKEAGDFSFTVESGESFSLRATDRLGNSISQTYFAVSSLDKKKTKPNEKTEPSSDHEKKSESWKQQQALFEKQLTEESELLKPEYRKASLLLADTEAWRNCDLAAKQKALKLVQGLLNKNFEFIGIESCGTKPRNELGIFRHKQLRTNFVLIPGGLVSTRLWLNPRNSWTGTVLDLLANGQLDRQTFSYFWDSRRFRKFRRRLQEVFKGIKDKETSEVVEFFFAKENRKKSLQASMQQFFEFFMKENRRREVVLTSRLMLVSQRELSNATVLKTILKSNQALEDGMAEKPYTWFRPKPLLNKLSEIDAGLRLLNEGEALYCVAGGQRPWNVLKLSPETVWSRENSEGELQSILVHAATLHPLGLSDLIGNAPEWVTVDQALWARIWKSSKPDPELPSNMVEEAEKIVLKTKHYGAGFGFFLPHKLCSPELRRYQFRGGGMWPNYSADELAKSVTYKKFTAYRYGIRLAHDINWPKLDPEK